MVISITKAHIKNEEFQTPLQTIIIRIYILTESPCDPYAHYYWRNTGQTMALKLNHASESYEVLLKQRLLGSIPRFLIQEL